MPTFRPQIPLPRDWPEHAKTGIVHAPVGKVSFDIDALEENFESLMDAIKRNRPAAAKGTYIRSVTVSSTMGPGVGIDPNVYR